MTVVVKGDNTFENGGADETFTVPLSSPTNASIGAPGTGTGTIVNDDPVPPPAIYPVTPGTATAADNDYTRIMHAVRDAADFSTISIEGTFNWTEPQCVAQLAEGQRRYSGHVG